MLHLLFRLLPTYGNWGGPGWSGGEWQDNYENTDWSVPPVDSLDELFKDHDRSYQKAIEHLSGKEKKEVWSKADLFLSKLAKDLSADPKNWPNPPSTVSVYYAWVYRKLVIFIFSIKSKI